MAISTPSDPGAPNPRSFANLKTERLTGITGTTLTFVNVIDPNFCLLFLNGTLIDPSTYTIVGRTIAVGTAALTSDIFVLAYHFRS